MMLRVLQALVPGSQTSGSRAGFLRSTWRWSRSRGDGPFHGGGAAAQIW